MRSVFIRARDGAIGGKVAALMALPSYVNTLANDTWTTTGFGPAMTPLQAGYVRQQAAVAWVLTSNSSEATRGAQMLQDCQVSTAAAFGFFGCVFTRMAPLCPRATPRQEPLQQKKG